MPPPPLQGPLPSRVALADGEALDSFLERLACANDLRPPHLLQILSTTAELGSTTTSFLVIKPDSAIVDRIAEFSAVGPESIRTATLARFDDGLPLHLGGLDPRQRHSFRQVVTQGWFPRFGSQACAECLADDGIWRLEWRLPILAICTHHRIFLSTRCAGCARPFRTHRHSPLRPVLGPGQPCGNPVGLRNPCSHSVLNHAGSHAAQSVIDATCAVRQALSRQPVMMLGKLTDPQTYLAELRHVATLLLHLLSRPEGPAFRDWAAELHGEAAERTTPLRGPRWGISPPRDAPLRGRVLDDAHQILSEPSLEDAAARLAPWFCLIGEISNGPSGWLLNRTTRTPIMDRLVSAAAVDHHHVGRRLDTSTRDGALLPTAIPQMIDADIYRQFFSGMLGSHEWIGRLYVSLCLLRTVAPVANWSEAAAQIGLDPITGARTARAASGRMQASPQTFARAVGSAAQKLPPHRDFRQMESHVRVLAHEPAQWYESWRTSMTPVRRRNTLCYTVTWMWCEVAQGAFDSSPAWTRGPTSGRRAAYRSFRERLPLPAQSALRALVLTPPSE